MLKACGHRCDKIIKAMIADIIQILLTTRPMIRINFHGMITKKKMRETMVDKHAKFKHNLGKDAFSIKYKMEDLYCVMMLR